jgi:hypothetical protein
MTDRVMLFLTAFAAVTGSLASTHDHARAVHTHRDTPDNTGKTPGQKPQWYSKLRAKRSSSQARAAPIGIRAAVSPTYPWIGFGSEPSRLGHANGPIGNVPASARRLMIKATYEL